MGICSYLSVNLHFILSKDFESLLNIDVQTIINVLITEKKVLLIFLILEIIVIAFLLLFSNKRKNIYHSEKVKLTDKIEVPAPAGDGQYGTAWWLQKKDYDKVFKYNIIDRGKDYEESCFQSGGIITNFERNGNLEKIYYIDDNLHTILIGSSGSGKSRSILIPTITMLGLASENMLISDVKGELYLYTAPKLKQLGYNVIALDFINFLKSNHYNFLDLVINAVEDNNIPLAESLVNDIVNILVEKNDKTEPIWVNGEMSVIKTAIMAVVLENKGKKEYQTLTNAYYFVAEMFKTDEDGEMFIDKYMKSKKAEDPIKKFFAVAGTAPSKTRGSFVAAALSTLQMFINEYVADTIQKSDFDLRDFASKKTVIFILLSDDKLTYHKLRKFISTTVLYSNRRYKQKIRWRVTNKNEFYIG